MAKTSVPIVALDGFELGYRNWLRGQTDRDDEVGAIARQYVMLGMVLVEHQIGRQEFMDEVWYSDSKPDD